jgi:hypothetical protein
MTQSALYRVFDADGALLYAGISGAPLSRLASHKGRAAWYQQAARVELQWFGCRVDAIAAENKVIAEESPLHNKLSPGKETLGQSSVGSSQVCASARQIPPTDTGIGALPVPGAGEFGMNYWHADVKGLHLRIMPTGCATWRYRWRHSGGRKTFTIGRFPALKLDEAVTIAKTLALQNAAVRVGALLENALPTRG